MGSLDGRNMIENGKHIHRSATETDHLTAGISRSELLLLMNAAERVEREREALQRGFERPR